MPNQIATKFFVVLFIVSPLAWSASPSVFNYAAKVSVKGAAFEGNGFFRFALVNLDCTDAATANPGNCVSAWSHDGSSSSGSEPDTALELIVSNGQFSVDIGDVSVVGMATLAPSVMQQTLYLRTWFDDGVNGSQQLKPDYLLNSVPYAVATTVASVSENAIGYKQAWQIVTGQRSANTIYQNTTGRPIMISMLAANPDQISMNVGESSPPSSRCYNRSCIVPPNHYYQMSSGFIFWDELR